MIRVKKSCHSKISIVITFDFKLYDFVFVPANKHTHTGLSVWGACVGVAVRGTKIKNLSR